MRKKIIPFLLCLGAASIQAQNFNYKAKVNPVKADGFHRIILPAALGGYTQNNYEDVRIMDNTGKEIPYLLNKEGLLVEDRFTEFPMSDLPSDDGIQSILITCPSSKKLNQLRVDYTNTDADRLVRLSGSKDKLTWYVIRDGFRFSAARNDNESTTSSQVIEFPTIDYAFLKLDINNGEKMPLPILRIGTESNDVSIPRYQKVESLTYRMSDSNKTTKIDFLCKPANRIDQLVFFISGPAMYHRNAYVVYTDEAGSSLKSLGSEMKRKYHTTTSSFILSSDDQHKINTESFLGNMARQGFSVIIENQDNECLKVDSIIGYQLVSTLTAKLEKNRSYFLYFGDRLLSPPSYDLPYFQQKIDKELPNVYTSAVIPKNTKEEGEYDGKSDQYLVWVGLAVVGLIMIYVIRSMLKKMEESK